MKTATSLKFTRNDGYWLLRVTADNEIHQTVWRTLSDAKAYAQDCYTLPKRSPKSFMANAVGVSR